MTALCEWCELPARGDAWHNDGRLHRSCGQPDHGMGWVPSAGTMRIGSVQLSHASHAAYLTYLQGDGVTLATRDLTNAITDAVVKSLGIEVTDE